MAKLLNYLGVLAKIMGRFEEAECCYRRALDILEPKLGPDHPSLASLYHNLGELEHARGRYELGKLFARRSVMIRERAFGPDYLDMSARPVQA